MALISDGCALVWSAILAAVLLFAYAIFVVVLLAAAWKDINDRGV